MELLTRHRHVDVDVTAGAGHVALWPRLLQLVGALAAVAVTVLAWLTPGVGPEATIVVVASIALVGIGQAAADRGDSAF